MIRAIAVIGLLAVAAAGGARADQNKAKAAPPAAKGAFKGGVPKGGAPKGPRMTNPTSPASRLYRLTPAERERALEKLPPAQQERIRNNLKWFDGLPKNQQEMVIKREERFSAMPPQEQRAILQQFQALNRLEPDRRRAVGAALRMLQGLPDEQRLDRINRPAFRNRFSPEELHMIEKLSEVMPPPL